MSQWSASRPRKAAFASKNRAPAYLSRNAWQFGHTTSGGGHRAGLRSGRAPDTIRAMLSILAAAVALAADPGPSSAADAVEACRRIDEGTARLACFDRAAAAFAEARARKDLIVMDRAEVRRTKRGLFGFSLPSLKLFGGDDDDPVQQLDAKIQGAAPYGYGFYMLTLDDGSQWETTDRVNGFSPRRGDAIRIKYGAFGYRASSLGSTISVRRVK